MKAICVYFIILFAMVAEARFRVAHYNIFELDSAKIQNPDRQLRAARRVVHRYRFDFLSLNEMQYDISGVPSARFQTSGQNARIFGEFLGLKNWSVSFHQANTGNNARRMDDGNYPTPETPNARSYADPVNFGLFPGQYSTAGLTRFKILDEKVITSISWKAFNPEVSFENFALADGSPVPEDIPLFDKTLTDLSVEIKGQKVHFVLLHTVPAFGFGNPKTVNFARNRDQLRFLEWYLTSETDIEIPAEIREKITPLDPKDHFVAMGDWNVDLGAEAPGAKVMQRILSKTKDVHPGTKSTYWGSSFAPGGWQARLDYMVTSQTLRTVRSKVDAPRSLERALGCYRSPRKFGRRRNRTVVTYRDTQKRYCYSRVANPYHNTKTGSDHLLLWAELDFVN